MEDTRYSEMMDRIRQIRHDANSPLTAALGHVQLLLEEPAAQDPDVQESLTVVEGELKRLIRILSQLNEVPRD